MFQVSVEENFSAGHALRGYRGKCENVHGHNYRVRVTLEGPQLDSIGLLVDFTQLKQVIGGYMGIAPGYARLIIAMILFFGTIYWLSRRTGRKADSNRV